MWTAVNLENFDMTDRAAAVMDQLRCWRVPGFSSFVQWLGLPKTSTLVVCFSIFEFFGDETKQRKETIDTIQLHNFVLNHSRTDRNQGVKRILNPKTPRIFTKNLKKLKFEFDSGQEM